MTPEQQYFEAIVNDGPTSSGPGPGQSNPQQPWWSQLGGQLGSTFSGLGDLIGGIKGTGSPDTVVYQQEPAAPQSNNTLLYVGLGIAGIVALALIFRIIK